MKKFLAFILSVILIISICTMGLFSITANAQGSVTVKGDNFVATGDNIEFTINVNGCEEATSVAIGIEMGASFDFVSGAWLKIGSLKVFDKNTLKGALGGLSSSDINGDVFKLVLKATGTSASKMYVKVNVIAKNGSKEVFNVTTVRYVDTNKCEHNFSQDFTVDKYPNAFEEGSKSRHCLKCDDVTDVTPIPRTSIYIGNCGENIKWAITEDGTLLIAGSGAIKNHGTSNSVPWYSYKAIINVIEIGEDITAIGHYAFDCFENLKAVKFGNSNMEISKYYAFSQNDIVFYGESGGKVEQYIKNKKYILINPQMVNKLPEPEIEFVGIKKIVIKPLDGCEYSIDGENWQSSNIIDRLVPDFEYTVYQRYIGYDSDYTVTIVTTRSETINQNPTSADLVLLRKELLKNNNNLDFDYNGDDEFNILDLVRLKKYLAGENVFIG